MSKIAVFGAGGRAGRRIVTEARGRGHDVTGVVRDPSAHSVESPDVAYVRGDVTDAVDVARLAAGHDVVVSTVADLNVAARDFYTRASTALVGGLAQAGVGRLIVIGIATTLETSPGVRVMDAPDFPAEYLEFCDGHAAGLAILREARGVDWLVINPAGDFDHGATVETGRAGGYRVDGDPFLAGTAEAGLISYAGFAVAVVDQIEAPTHHRTQLGVIATESTSEPASA